MACRIPASFVFFQIFAIRIWIAHLLRKFNTNALFQEVFTLPMRQRERTLQGLLSTLQGAGRRFKPSNRHAGPDGKPTVLTVALNRSRLYIETVGQYGHLVSII